MSVSNEQRRFNWIHLYCDALRWALVNEVTAGNYREIVTFQDIVNGLRRWWLVVLPNDDLRRWVAAKRGRGCYWSSVLSCDFWYLYDLEAELWGANFDRFLDRNAISDDVALEPFRFVLLFYLIERALKLLLAHLCFLDYELGNLSHARIRNAAYAHLFERECLARWFPFPFNLAALTHRLVHGDADCLRHRAYGFVGNHFAVVGKTHYTQVVESALRQAVMWQRDRHTNRGQRPPRGSIRAFFFDPLWRYSESYRYRVPLASDYIRQNPFYWGLNLRWLGSAFLCIIELWLYTLSARLIGEVWDTYAQQSRSPTLQAVQLPRWQTIRDASPQSLI